MLETAEPDLAVSLGSLTAPRSAPMTLKAPLGARASSAGIQILADRRAFDALRDEWEQLEALASGPVLFQSYAWCRAVWDHHTRHDRSFEPLVVSLREHGRLVGILPLQRVRVGPSRIATGFGEPYQQYTDVVLGPDAPRDAAARLLEAACRLKGCDGLELLKVRDDSPLAPLLAARHAIRSNEDAAPFVDLQPYTDFNAYHATVNAKTRKNIRNTRNRLARAGTLEHRVWSSPADADALVARAQQGRERWLKDQGLTSRAFRDPTFASFAQSVAGAEAGLSTLAMSLVLDGQPVADQWGFLFNGRYYAYVATWMPEFEESSPGKLHLEEVIRACHERGVAIADFLMPAVRYKFTWTDQATPVADYAVPLSFKAGLQFSVWSGMIRPVLKSIALRVPRSARNLIAGAILKRR